MEDSDILRPINEMVDEERQLLQLSEQSELTDEQRQRMHQLAVHLDQCWDLLRQRRARRAAGLDPADAKLRDPDTVERYAQ